MTPLLVCAATREELETFAAEQMRETEVLEEGRLWQMPGGILAATGAGIPVTMLRLLPLLERFRPALLLNTGIAGAYPAAIAADTFAVGDVVLGLSETFADLGLELPEKDGFLPLGGLPFADEMLRSPLRLLDPAWAEGIPALRRGHGATVNACTGTDATGALRSRLFAAHFESMEGAAVALAGREHGIPVVEVRAISNLAARRDMRPENIRRALAALSAFWAKHRHHLLDGVS